jgi:competence ComEA-like helix-hairpin-helix protein
MKIAITLFLLFYCGVRAQRRQDSTYYETEGTISDILQEPDEESDNSDLYNAIEELIDNPVDINKAGLEELQRIPNLDFRSANAIINYREKFGHFFSVGELYSIKDLAKETVGKITPFLTVSNNLSQQQISSNSFFTNSSFKIRNRIQNELQKSDGFVNSKFVGSPYKIYNRFVGNFKNYEIGFLTDKDPGENSIHDFSSGFISIKNLGFVKNIVFGDYILKFGQGLALWGPYGFSKGADVIYSYKKNADLINRYSSSTENNFFRGTALEMQFGSFSFSTFYSKNKFDANIDSVSKGILSTPIDGLHRTENEIAKRKSAQETMYGSAFSYKNNFLNAGILYYHSEFSNPFIPGSVFDIEGDRFNYYSFYYNLNLSEINFFGEAAYSGISVASITGVEIPIGKNFIFVSSIRSYPRNFNNLHGFSFGEKSGTEKNEFGIYNGFRWRTPAGIINFYYDQFKFPYASYGIPMPSSGNEFLVDYSNKFIKNFETRFRFKYENKETALTKNNITILGNRIKQISRIELIYRLNKKVRLKGRFQYDNINFDGNYNEEGFLIFQDLQFRPSPIFSFYTRIAFYKTDSFNSAVYEYENDLAGILLNTALFGEGIRWYAVFRFKPVSLITISCKYSETYKPGEKSLGSGLSEINGDLDNRISLQVDINY